jgi:hypothetical protein
MWSTMALLALLPLMAAAQLIGGSSGSGRADIDALSIGWAVNPTRALQFGNGAPVLNNRIYTDGTFWGTTDSFPDEFADDYTKQIVTDIDGLTDDSADYLTVTTRRDTTFYVCRDDANAGDYAAGWELTSLTVSRPGIEFTCLSKSFPAGETDIPGNDGDVGTEQFIIFARDANKGLAQTVFSAGTISFNSASYTMDDDGDTETVFVSRVDGSAGAATVDITCSVVCKGVLSQPSLSWANGEGGTKSIVFTSNDITPSGTSTLTLTISGGNATLGGTSVTTIIVNDQSTPPAAQTYYVNPTDGGCTDSGDGLARTSGGGFEPWCTISRALIQSHPGVGSPGHVNLYIEDGNYRNQPIIPGASGVSATQNIRYCAIGGDVYLMGPASGSILYGIDVPAARRWVTIGGCDSNRIKIDGEVVFGTGGGQVEKGEAPSTVAHVQRGAQIFGDDITLDIDLIRTAGWNGIYIDPTASNPILRVNLSQHGTPWHSDGNDFGDTIWVDRPMPDNLVLIDGGSAGRTHYLGGHSAGHYTGGRIVMRGIAFKGSWGAVSTFTASATDPDGNRGMTLTREVDDSHVHDVVFNGSGRAQDQRWVECFKSEGTRSTFSNVWVRNCQGWANIVSSAAWSIHARNIRHAHQVYENVGGPIARYEDYEGDDDGDSEISDIKYANIIVKDFGQNTDIGCCGSSGWDDELFNFQLTGSQTLESIGFRVDGMTIENDSGSCNDVYVTVYGGGNQRSTNIPGWEAIYPNVFDDITCTTNAQLDNLPAASTDSTVPEMAAYLTLDVADTLSRGTGVWLTTATNAGTNSTNLCVADVAWFSVPASAGVPGLGQWSGGYDVRIQGGGSNTTYTAANTTDEAGVDGCITLGTARTWAIGANVGYGMSGAAPNRGYVR